MNNSHQQTHSCEIIQLSISDAIDANQRLTRSDQKHIESCPDCAAFYQLWQNDSSLSAIASGSLSEHLNLTQPIISALNQNTKTKTTTLSEHNIIRGKFIKIASIAAMIAVICVGALNFSGMDAQESNVASTPAQETELDNKVQLPAIQITLTEEKIEQVLEENYQSLSKSATKKWKSATTGIVVATEYIADGTHHFSSKYF
jgi:hypothetical protein